MADLRLRLFAREPEEPNVRARLFSESIRSGVGSRERLQLLADLGDPAAQIALGSEQRPPYLDYRVWVGALQRDPAALAHLALAVLQHVRPAFSEHGVDAPCALIERVVALEGLPDVDPQLLDELSASYREYYAAGEPDGAGPLLRCLTSDGLACAKAQLRDHPSSVSLSGERLLTTLASLLYSTLPPTEQEQGLVAGEAHARQLVLELLGEWVLAGEPALPRRQASVVPALTEQETLIPSRAWEPLAELQPAETAQDGALGLRIRLQAGRLDEGDLTLAAALGYAPAREALGEAAPRPEKLRAERRAFEEFRWACEQVAKHPRAAAAALRRNLERALPLWEERFPKRTAIRRAYDASRDGAEVSAGALHVLSKACTAARRKASNEGHSELIFVCELARTLVACVRGQAQEQDVMFTLLRTPRSLDPGHEDWLRAFRALREGALPVLIPATRTGKGTDDPLPFRPAVAVPYSPRTTYSAGQQLVHPTFGSGEVLEVQGKKVKVRFGEASKLLAHGL